MSRFSFGDRVVYVDPDSCDKLEGKIGHVYPHGFIPMSLRHPTCKYIGRENDRVGGGGQFYDVVFESLGEDEPVAIGEADLRSGTEEANVADENVHLDLAALEEMYPVGTRIELYAQSPGDVSCGGRVLRWQNTGLGDGSWWCVLGLDEPMVDNYSSDKLGQLVLEVYVMIEKEGVGQDELPFGLAEYESGLERRELLQERDAWQKKYQELRAAVDAL